MSKVSSQFHQFLILATLFFFLLPPLVYAQSELLIPLDKEMILFQEIPSVYGASKYEQKVTQAPSSVSIVTAAEIKKYGYRTLADILRSIRGFYTTYDRNYHYLGVRGFLRPGDYDTRYLLLVNGHRTNDNIYGSAYIGTDFNLDMALIDRVEVIRGPSSSLYGTSAFFGVINVITKRGRDLKAAEISGEAASFETYKGRLSCGNKFQNGLEMLFSGSTYDSQGQRLYFKEFDDPATNNGFAENCDYDQYHSFYTNLSFRDFALQGGYVSREKGIPTAAWDTVFNDQRTKCIDGQGYLDLQYKHDFATQLDVMARLFYNRYNYDGDYVWDYSEDDEPDLVVNKDVSRGEWWGGELKFTQRVCEKHKFILGAEYQDNIRQEQSNYDEEPYLLYFEDKRDTRNWALYIQDEFEVLKSLIFNLGVRHDDYETFGGTTNPRLALIYNPLEKTTFKLLYGEAFRAPSAYELYYHDGEETQKVSPDLKPETINTYELALEEYLGDNLRVVISGFYYKMGSLITLRTDPTDDLLVYKNMEEVEAKGLELEMEGKWASGLESRISYTIQQAEDQKTGSVLTNSPKNLSKLNLIVPLVKDKFFAGAEVQYTSKRKTVTNNYADAFFCANLTFLGQDLLKGLEVSASIYNLFDQEYRDPGSEEHQQDVIEQDGRSFRLKLTYGF